MLKALLDTNQRITSLLGSQGLQRQLIDAWRRRAFLLLLVPGQVDEVSEVLVRPRIAKKYRVASADLQAFLELLRGEATLLPQPAPGVCRDPDDDYLLGCAALGGADYLVTGDDDLLSMAQYRDVVVVDARTFLSVLAAQRD